MQTLYGQQTQYFYKQTSHSTCQVGQLQVGQHHRMSGTKLFSMTAAQTTQAVRRRRKTKIQWMPVISSTLKTYTMMMQKLRPHNSRHRKRCPNRRPNRHLNSHLNRHLNRVVPLPTMPVLMIPLLCHLLQRKWLS